MAQSQFTYTSMADPHVITQIRQAALNHFKHYDALTHSYYGYAVPVGYEREVVSTVDGHVVFNNFDHNLNHDDVSYQIGTLDDSPDVIVENYLKLLIDHDLDHENCRREKQIFDLTHSDLVAFD